MKGGLIESLPLRPRVAFSIAAAWLFALVGSGLRAEGTEGEQLFVRRILPLLEEKCLSCHGRNEEKIKGGFDLRSLEAALRGGESCLPGLVPGQPEESPLYLAATRLREDWEAMPPKEAERLDEGQLALIREWIAAGAPWPDDARVRDIAAAHEKGWEAGDGVVIKTAGGLSPEWSQRKYLPEGLWAYQPVKKPVPQSGESWSEDLSKGKSHPVDALLARHLPAGVKSAPPAEATTFLRRATFDLTGLPPTPEEITAFETEYSGDAAGAVRTLVDRLLASPHYGERMAQHWLDVVRYADSSGFANDFERGNAWRYRDYVVRAFNADKPYDRFIREQIAGDEIDPENPEMLIATGFLRMGPWELTGMEVPRIARQRFLDDVTNSIGETFLAHSLQCARCHDHKFDPVPTLDYYAIQAVFATTQFAERDAAFLPNENTKGMEERIYLERSGDEYRATLAALDRVLLENAQGWYRETGKDPATWNGAVARAEKDAAAGVKRKKRSLFSVFGAAREILRKEGIAEDAFPPKLVGFTPEQFGMERVARKGLERLQWEMDRYEPYALSVYTGVTPERSAVLAPERLPKNPMAGGELERTCILTGGDPFGTGPEVRPGVLSVLRATAAFGATLPESPQGRRAAFADWVAHPDNPLTTRTIVNRVWMWHFGTPIAGNPNNFGSSGKKPTHPELLDWLAARFVESGWSFKELHRIILSSEAYRRSATISEKSGRKQEELEECYAVFKPRRLSAEELCDAMLAASGELNRTLGGIPNRPEINLEAAMQPRQVMGTFAAAWVPNPKPEQRHRRSLYALKLRGQSDPLREVFNAPAPDFSCERRETSTVTPQVFALFNGQASQARSLALAKRVLGDAKDDEAAAIRRCFLLVFGRGATEEEVARCLDHWRAMVPIQEKAVFAKSAPPLTVRREAVEENTGEKFAFDEKLHAYADFVPDLRPGDCDARTRALGDVCLALLNANEFVYVY